MPCVARGKEPFLLQPTGGPFLGPLFPTNLLQPAIYAGSTLLVTRIAASVSGRHPMQQVGFFLCSDLTNGPLEIQCGFEIH